MTRDAFWLTCFWVCLRSLRSLINLAFSFNVKLLFSKSTSLNRRRYFISHSGDTTDESVIATADNNKFESVYSVNYFLSMSKLSRYSSFFSSMTISVTFYLVVIPRLLLSLRNRALSYSFFDTACMVCDL